jgi:hypothetical protein
MVTALLESVGSANVDSTLKQLNGMRQDQDVIDAKQKQLDDWLASSKDYGRWLRESGAVFLYL